jgi:membrane protein
MGLLNRIARVAAAGGKSALGTGLALLAGYAVANALERRGLQYGPEPVSAEPAPLVRGWPYWKGVLYRTYEEIIEDRLLALAAGVVFYGLLAIFPAITALVSSYALFAKASTINNHLALVSGLMPQDAYSIVDEQVTRIVTRTTGGLSFAFFFGLALALWSANAGVKAIIDALNIVYDAKERRSFICLNLVSLAFTVGALVILLLAIGAIVVLPVWLSYLPFGTYGIDAMAWLRWPALLVMLLGGLAMLYRFGPNLDQARFQWISYGAVFAALAILLIAAMWLTRKKSSSG